MAWTPDVGGGWTHTGGTLEVWAFDTPMTAIGSVVFQLFDPSKPVAINVYASPYQDSCFQVSITGGTGGTIQLKKRTLGTLGAALTTTPNNPAHNLLDGNAYTLEVRWVSGVISVFIDGSTTAAFTYTIPAADQTGFTGIGFESDVDGAQVGGATMYALVRVFVNLADVAWWVAGGTLYASDSGRSGAKTIGQFFDSTARIRGAEGKQHAYIIDGSRIVDFDAALMAAALLSLDAGTMPGQTSLNTPLGATTANAIDWENDRLVLVDQNTKQASAIGFGTPTKSFAVTSDVGTAYAIPAKVGQPLIAVFNAENNRSIFGSSRSTWSQIGDPAIGYPEVSRMHNLIGFTGPFSAVLCERGMLFMHTNEGACVIPNGGGVEHLSRDVLTDVIQQDMAADTLYVSLCPDLKRHGIWVFLTPSDGTSTGRHLFYDVRIGGFTPGPEGGGWFPIDFASHEIQPTCSMSYLGEVVFGTRDGRMLFMDEAADDDAGDEFTTLLHLNMIRDMDMGYGTLLRSFELAMGIGSADTTLTLIGGDTPERAYTDGYTVWSGTMDQVRDGFSVSGAAAALILKMQSTGRFALESCQVDSQRTTLNPIPHRTAIVPAAPCQPPAPAPAEPDDDTGGGPGPGGVDPGTCTECATWMAENTTGQHGGEDAYRLGGLNPLEAAQAEVTAALATLELENICDLGEGEAFDPILYVTTNDAAFVAGPEIAASAFLALDPGAYDPLEKTWLISFRCGDQVA